MPNIIPVPVVVSVGISGDNGVGTVRNFGSFSLVPYATTRNGGLDIDRWLYIDRHGDTAEMHDRFLFNIMPKKLLCHVCVHTFEAERDHLPLVVTIDDQQWTFPIRARELEFQEVHYQIEIEGEWMTLTEAYISDMVDEDMLIFAERELLPTIDFADHGTVFDQMS